MGKKAVLPRIENDREITRGTDAEFLFQLQRSLLHDLKEAGLLNEAQLSYAEEKLHRQRCKEQNHPGR